jgi:hypothetical protein
VPVIRNIKFKTMNILFAVPYLEIEYGWGERDYSYKVYDNLEECIKATKEASDTGNYEGGYYGPQRPLHYYETPDEIEGTLPKHVESLTYSGKVIYIR